MKTVLELLSEKIGPDCHICTANPHEDAVMIGEAIISAYKGGKWMDMVATAMEYHIKNVRAE